MHIPQKFLPKSRQKLLRSAPGQSFPAVAVMPLAAKVLKRVMVNLPEGTKRQVPAKHAKPQLRNRTATVFSQENYVMFEHSIFRRNFL
ncbi:single-stranded DNA-binding protein [Escherichia coli]